MGRETAKTAVCLSSAMAKRKPERPKPLVDPKVLDFFRGMGRRGGKKGGKRGGRKGGKARWEGVSPQERSVILRRAVEARWKKARKRKVDE